MNPYFAECFGTMMLILLGNGVVAGVLLNKSKSQQAGWVVITLGWGLAVTLSVYMVGAISGAHLNPAVTVALASIGQGGFTWAQVPGYILAQLVGAMLGATLVWLTYLPHWKETEDSELKLAAFNARCSHPSYPFQLDFGNRGNLCSGIGSAHHPSARQSGSRFRV